MNLELLWKLQSQLDERIKKENGTSNNDIFEFQVQAFLTELGEVSNEWKGFKHWSKNAKPRKAAVRHAEIPGRKSKVVECYDPLLEEYVDGLHFIISISIMCGIEAEKMSARVVYPSVVDGYEKISITRRFLSVYRQAANLTDSCDAWSCCYQLFQHYLDLGAMLGYEWEQIEQAYLDKNKENHARQDRGY